MTIQEIKDDAVLMKRIAHLGRLLDAEPTFEEVRFYTHIVVINIGPAKLALPKMADEWETTLILDAYADGIHAGKNHSCAQILAKMEAR